MAKSDKLEILRVHLFDDVEQLKDASIHSRTRERILRMRAAFTYWNKYPLKKDAEMRDFIMDFADVERSAAYEDIQLLKILIGEFQETTKEFHRFRFNTMVNNAYEMAERKQDAKAMAAAAANYAKYNQLDKEDAVKIPWDEIIPQRFEPTSDPSVIGIKPVPNIRSRIESMKKKYIHDIAEDITFEEVDFNEDQYFENEQKDIL